MLALIALPSVTVSLTIVKKVFATADSANGVVTLVRYQVAGDTVKTALDMVIAMVVTAHAPVTRAGLVLGVKMQTALEK